jgi:site-specific recombinase
MEVEAPKGGGVPVAPPPDRVRFSAQFAVPGLVGRALAPLHEALRTLTPEATLEERHEQLIRIGQWLRIGAGKKAKAKKGEPPGEPPSSVRLRTLVRVLGEVPVFRVTLARVVTSVLAETDAVRMFSELGLPNDRGILEETTDRLARRLLPRPYDERDLRELLEGLLPKRIDAEWVRGLPHDLVASLALELSEPEGTTWEPVRLAMADAVALLGLRIAALGLSDDIRVRSPESPVTESPFWHLRREVDAAVDAWKRPNGEDGSARLGAIASHALACRAALQRVHERLETHGVSVDVVYRIEVIEKALARMEGLLLVLGAPPGEARSRALVSLLGDLAHARVRDHSLRDVLRGNLSLLARKIIERAGHTGEHYIAATKREYWKMLASAAGGGFLTAGTAVGKFFTKWQHYPMFIDGMASTVNYAGSFILMQLLGFTLATKQPSMTAAALAGALKEHGDGDMKEIVAMIARTTRTQLIAVIGNLGLVIPTVILIDLYYVHFHGEHFLSRKAAETTFASFHPLHSLTIWYAALTGVLLWMSSIAAGWVENWAVYRRIPEAIAEHRMRKLFGRRAMAAVSRWFSRHIAGFGGNFTLGLLLAMTPVMGVFFGLPLDVRHVTLSTAGWTFSARVTGLEAENVLGAAAGIGCMALLNFGVSFVLALSLALRARHVESGARFKLLKALIRHLFRHPTHFVFPPRT